MGASFPRIYSYNPHCSHEYFFFFRFWPTVPIKKGAWVKTSHYSFYRGIFNVFLEIGFFGLKLFSPKTPIFFRPILFFPFLFLDFFFDN